MRRAGGTAVNAAAVARRADHHRSILLVEDNPLDLDLMRRALSSGRSPAPLHVARDGEEALEWLSRWEAGEPPPTLVLLDWKLPKVDGREVLWRIKSHPRLASTVVVVMTTSDEPQDVRAAYAHGANSYVVKPLLHDRFVEMAEHIDRYWMGVSLPSQ